MTWTGCPVCIPKATQVRTKPRIEIRGPGAARVRALCEAFAQRGYDLAASFAAPSAHGDDLRRQASEGPLVRLDCGDSKVFTVGACYFSVSEDEELTDQLGDLLLCFERLGASPRKREPRNASSADRTIVGQCRQLRDLRAYLAKVASVDSTVLVTGETGTGKQLMAELIHRTSARRNGPFITVNCAAIPDSLVESELFGYERGAFTGAMHAKPGKLEMADGGTFFLDEIGDMHPVAQAKLLNVLETRQVERLGARRAQRINVRFIAATNQDLEAMVEKHAFRRDLYYRLNVTRLHLPPLRERRDDIPSLLAHYARELNRDFGIKVDGFTPGALECLRAYPWPGNVRELRNVLEAVFVNRPTGLVSVADLPESCRRHAASLESPAHERELLLSALTTTSWNVSKAARSLQWSRMTVYRKMAKHRIDRPADFPPQPVTATLSPL